MIVFFQVLLFLIFAPLVIIEDHRVGNGRRAKLRRDIEQCRISVEGQKKYSYTFKEVLEDIHNL